MKRVIHCLIASVYLASSFSTAFGNDDWNQWRGNNRDGEWHESGIVQTFTTDSLNVLWRQPISSGYTGPTVAEGKVFVMDRQTQPNQIERVHCFDSLTGTVAWTHAYDARYSNVGYTAGPRASVTINDGKAYALGSMGHLHCLSVKDGSVVWNRNLNEEYGIIKQRRMPIWGIAASPIIFNNLLILHIGANNGASIIALDKNDGKEVWRALDDRAQYSSPILHKQNGKDVLICWTGDSCAGLNPADGSVYWRHPIKPKNMPIGVATPIVKDNQIFLTSFYDGAHLLRMKADEMGIELVWSQVGVNEKQTKGIHSMIGTPVWIDDHIYGVDSFGELRCLDAKTGRRVWTSQEAVPKSRWSTIHFVTNGDKQWMFNERGELILATLTAQGFNEICRAKLIEPTRTQLRQRGGVCWSHPAYANKCVFLRNDKELICVSLAEPKKN